MSEHVRPTPQLAPGSVPTSSLDRTLLHSPTPIWEQIGNTMVSTVDAVKNGLNKLFNNTEFKEKDIRNFIEENLVDSFGMAFTFVSIGNNADGTRRWMPKAIAMPIPGMSTRELEQKVKEINQLFEDQLKPNVATGIDNQKDPNNFTRIFIESLGKAKPKESPKFSGTDVDKHSSLILARNSQLQNIFLKRGVNGTPVSPDSLSLASFAEGMKQWDGRIPLDGYTQTLLNAQAVFATVSGAAGASENEKKIHLLLESNGKDRLAYHKNLLESYTKKTKTDLDDLSKSIMEDLGVDPDSLNGQFAVDEHILAKSSKELMNSDTPAEDLLERLGKGIKNMNALEFAGLLAGAVYLLFNDTADGKFRKALMGVGATLVLAKPITSMVAGEPMTIDKALDTLYSDTKNTAGKYMKGIAGYISTFPGPLREFFMKNPEFINGLQAMSVLTIEDMEEIVMSSSGEDSFTQTVTILERKFSQSGSGLERHHIETWLKKIGLGDGERTRAFLEEIALGAANVGHIPRENMKPEDRTTYLRTGFEKLKASYGPGESIVATMIMQAVKGDLRDFQITLNERLEPISQGEPTASPDTGLTPEVSPIVPPRENDSGTSTTDFSDAGGAASPAQYAAAAAMNSGVGVTSTRNARPTGYAEGIPHRRDITLSTVEASLLRDNEYKLYLGEKVVDRSNTIVVGSTSYPVFRIDGRYYGDVAQSTPGKLAVDGSPQTIEPLGVYLNKFQPGISDKVKQELGTVQFEPRSNKFYTDKGIVFYYHPVRKEYVMEKAGPDTVLGTENQLSLTEDNVKKSARRERLLASLRQNIDPQYRFDLQAVDLEDGTIDKAKFEENGAEYFQTVYEGARMFIKVQNKAVYYALDGRDPAWKDITDFNREQFRANRREAVRTQERAEQIQQNRLRQVQEVVRVYNDLGLGLTLANPTNPTFISATKQKQITESGKTINRQVSDDLGNRALWIQAKNLGYLGIRLEFAAEENYDAENTAKSPDVLTGLYLGDKARGVRIDLDLDLPLKDRVQKGLIDAMNKYYFPNNSNLKILSFDGAGLTGHLGKKGTVTLEVHGTKYPGFDLTELPMMDKDISDPNQPSEVSEVRKSDIQSKKDAYFKALPEIMGVADGKSQIIDIRFGDPEGDAGKYIYAIAYDVESGVRVFYTWEYDGNKYTFSKAELMEGGKEVNITNDKNMSDIISSIGSPRVSSDVSPNLRSYKEKISNNWRGHKVPAENAPFSEWMEYHVYERFHNQDALRGFWGGFNYHTLPKDIATEAAKAAASIDASDYDEFLGLVSKVLDSNASSLKDWRKKPLKEIPSLAVPLRTAFAMGPVLKQVTTQWEYNAVESLLLNPQVQGSPTERAQRIGNVLMALKGFRNALKNPLDTQSIGQVRDLFDDQKWFGYRWISGAGQAVGNMAAWTGSKFSTAWKNAFNRQERSQLSASMQETIMNSSDLQEALKNGDPAEIRSTMITLIERVLERGSMDFPEIEGEKLRSVYTRGQSTRELQAEERE